MKVEHKSEARTVQVDTITITLDVDDAEGLLAQLDQQVCTHFLYELRAKMGIKLNKVRELRQ